jgi:protein-tyrosine kinase
MNSRPTPAALDALNPSARLDIPAVTPGGPAKAAAELRRHQSARLMGQALLENGKLTMAQIDQVIRTQSEDHLRFGEAAVALGYVQQADVDEVLASQFDYQTASDSRGVDRQIHPSLEIAHQPFSLHAEAIRRFRSEILVRLGEQRCILLAVVSPHRGEGKSHVAASLAIAFAQLHIKTLLIDADLRHPHQHILFDLNNQSGLSSMLAGRSEGSLAATALVLPDLRVLCAGPRPPNPSELLSTNRFGDMLMAFADETPVIILDTSASSESSDAQVAAQLAGRAVIVGRKNVSQLAALQKTVHEMQSASVQVVGSYYNNPPAATPWWQRLLRRKSPSPGT